jgi:mRNA interferase MazF
VEVNAKQHNLEKDSVILLEQMRTIDKRRLKEKITHLSEEFMNDVDEAIRVSLGLIQI